MSGECTYCGYDRRLLLMAIKGKGGDMNEAKSIIQACPACRLAVAFQYRYYTGECETCGQVMVDHRRCFQCNILLGPGHEDIGKEVKKGVFWCGHCQKMRKPSKGWRELPAWNGEETAASEELKAELKPKKYRKKRYKLGRGKKKKDVTDSELTMLRRIAADPAFDDANLQGADIRTCQALYRGRFIDAVPVEGSDAAVEALSVTEAGKNILKAKESVRILPGDMIICPVCKREVKLTISNDGATVRPHKDPRTKGQENRP